MNILGIIAEYNPFHNGHKYHIEEAKRKSNADFTIVIMSGTFTQQGNISVIDKFKKAQIAIKYGADLVIELPTIYAISSSENFSFGAINILNNLGCITHLSFGAECDNIQKLINIANILITNEKAIIKLTKKYLLQGITSAKARDLALKELLDDDEYLEISSPNNILALEYLKSLKKLNSTIIPVIVKRKNSNHNDIAIVNQNSIASATAIRNILKSKNSNLSLIKSLVPDYCFNILNSNTLTENDNLFKILKYEILRLNKKGLADIYEVKEGLENKIYNSILKSNSYDDLINSIKSKRYTLGRIKRILIYILLGITNNIAKDIINVNYARILKVSEKGKDLLKIINKSKKENKLDILSNLSAKNIEALDFNVIKSIEIDILSSNILSTLSKSDLNGDYTNSINFLC